MAKEVSIDTLEQLLNSESDIPMEILPDGTIKVGSGKKQEYPRDERERVITFRQAIASGY